MLIWDAEIESASNEVDKYKILKQYLVATQNGYVQSNTGQNVTKCVKIA